jgi:ribonuclease-3
MATGLHKRREILRWAKENGLSFDDLELFFASLTHRSYPREYGDLSSANENLEFLGDAVLSLVVTSYIYKKLPNLNVGELAKLRARIVAQNSLFNIGKSIGLDSAIILGKKEEENLGREKPSIISDTLEALLGAIFLDGGLRKAESWIIRNFHELIEKEISSPTIDDFKTQLQEITAKVGIKDIKYVTEKEMGPDHRKIFYVSVFLNGEKSGSGEGMSKKQAEQLAAAMALERMRRPIN